MLQIYDLSNLLNGDLHFGFTILFLNGQKKDDMKKKTRRKAKQCYHNDICGQKGTVVPVKLKLQRESFDQGY